MEKKYKMPKELESVKERSPEEKKIHDVIILFYHVNADILLGQIESIVQNHTHLTVLENRQMERGRLALLVLQCIGNLPEALLYELDFSTLLIDYAIYEIRSSSGDLLKEGQHAERT